MVLRAVVTAVHRLIAAAGVRVRLVHILLSVAVRLGGGAAVLRLGLVIRLVLERLVLGILLVQAVAVLLQLGEVLRLRGRQGAHHRHGTLRRHLHRRLSHLHGLAQWLTGQGGIDGGLVGGWVCDGVQAGLDARREYLGVGQAALVLLC